MRVVGYNSQRDNFEIKGIPGSSQCFATSAWMLLSYYAPAKYNVTDDLQLKWYIGDLTKSSAENEYEWSCQADMIGKYLKGADVNKNVSLGIDLNSGIGTVSPDNLRALLKNDPVIIGTRKMSWLPGGHIILGIDNASNGSIICHDPYGNALSGYKDQNGKYVEYPISLFDAAYPDGPIRCLWVS
jgi:hypothetical protein